MTRWAAACAWLVLLPSTARAAELDPVLAQFLEHPQAELKRVPRGFRIIALSNLAEACASGAASGALAHAPAVRCVSRLVELAQGAEVSPLSGSLKDAPLEGHGLYLSHLGVVLAAYQRVAGDGRFLLGHQRLVKHLAAASLRDPERQVASYPRTKVRWPADQSATLYALWLFDRLEHAEHSAAPIKAYLERMARAQNEWKLPPSELTGRTRWSKYPRGCALSFTVRYLAPYAPEEAERIWKQYKLLYAVDLGAAAGFREWPPGVDGPADLDSGPVVSGVGAAATGLAITAARVLGDEGYHGKLLSSAAIAKAIGRWEKASDNVLARAIELNGRTWTRWYE